VIELSKLAGETLEILANQKLVARGEVVVVNEKYGVRLTEIISPSERIERLQ
jgi:flagellar motor switch protein FliN/FliY